MLSPHSSTHSISPALSISPSPCVFSVLFQRNHSQLCFSSVFPDFLTQGVSQQMFRLAKIPNSRCLAKIKTNREKKTELPRPKEPSSVELQLLPLAVLPTGWPHQGEREWGMTGWHRSGV